MPTLRIVFLLISFLPVSFPNARADALSDLKNELTGLWLAKWAGENRAQILKIEGIERRTEETFLLDAEFGGAISQKYPVKAEFVHTAGERKLVLTLSTGARIYAGARIIATQSAD